jgi:hypothetical protein
MKINNLKYLFLFILILTKTSLFAQNKPEIPKMSIQFDIGLGKNGTGDMSGFQINTEVKKYFRKKKSFSLGIGATIHDGSNPLTFTDATGKSFDGSLRYNTDGLQLTGKFGLSFIRNTHNDLGLQIGGLLRYQSTSYPDDVTVYYQGVTGLPFPVTVIINNFPQKTYAFGGIVQLYYNYTLNEKIYIGTNAAFQVDTNGDVITQLNLSCGMKF